MVVFSERKSEDQLSRFLGAHTPGPVTSGLPAGGLPTIKKDSQVWGRVTGTSSTTNAISASADEAGYAVQSFVDVEIWLALEAMKLERAARYHVDVRKGVITVVL